MAFKYYHILRSFLNILLVFLAYLPWLAIHAGVKPFKRGFYCDDESLMHPFKESTIPGVAVLVLGISVNAVTFATFDIISLLRVNGKMTPLQGYRLGRFNVRQEVVNFCDVFLVFMFGAVIQQTAVNIGKFSIGRLRPHFFAVCQVNYTAFSCVDQFNQPRYVTEDVCTAVEEYRTLNMRLSFPSGHSSLSAYCVVFIVENSRHIIFFAVLMICTCLLMYLEARMTWRRLNLMKGFLQAVFLWLALGVCLSRISDYKHHWSDVLAGVILGGCVAVFVVKYVLRLSSPSTFDLPAQIIDEISVLTSASMHSENLIRVEPKNISGKPSLTHVATVI